MRIINAPVLPLYLRGPHPHRHTFCRISRNEHHGKEHTLPLLQRFGDSWPSCHKPRRQNKWGYKRKKDGTINCYFGRRRGSKNGHVYADIVPSIGKSDSGDRQRAQLFAGNILIVILTSECLPRRPQAKQQRDEATSMPRKPRYWPISIAAVVPLRPAPRAKKRDRTIMSSILVATNSPAAAARVVSTHPAYRAMTLVMKIS